MGFTLRQLDGRFFTDAKPDRSRRSHDRLEGAQGVIFQCPKCAIGKPPGEPDGVGFAGAHYILVSFANPRGVPVAPQSFDDNPRWQMSGSSLDDLTLSPSIDISRDRKGNPQPGCQWHGWVKAGVAA